jgi:hypothetical protein
MRSRIDVQEDKKYNGELQTLHDTSTRLQLSKDIHDSLCRAHRTLRVLPCDNTPIYNMEVVPSALGLYIYHITVNM